MNKVFQVQYTYTETYCHPSPSEWERVTRTICTTLDESLAIEARDAHNAKSDRVASITSYELTSR